MKMKFYVLPLVEKDPFVCACEISDDEVTVKLFLQSLEGRLKSVQPSLFLNREIVLCKKNKKKLDYEAELLVSKLLNNGQDVYVDFIPTKGHQEASKIHSEEKKDVKPKETPKKREDIKQRIVNIGATDPSEENVPKTVGDWINVANRWKKVKHMNKAVEIYNALLAAKCATIEIYDDIIQIYLDANRPKVALKYVKKAKKEFPEQLGLLLREGECYLGLENGDKALEVYMDASKQLRGTKHATMEVKHLLQTGMCKAYQLKEETDMALVVIQGVVREDRQNLPAMLEYAKLTYKLSDAQASEAGVILLTCLVNNKEDPYRQRLLTDLAREPGGLKHLTNAMVDAKSDPAALAFLATVLRDNGALKQSLELYELALSVKPNHINIFLNYIHLLEVLDRHDDIVQKVLCFLEKYEMYAGCISSKQVYNCLQHLKDKPVYLNDDAGQSEEKESALEQIITSYGDEELYLLALWFTLIKVLYIKGALASLPRLIKLIDPLYKGKDLHQTYIKNEAAYYGCISQVVASWPKNEETGKPEAPSVGADNKFVYIAGDSHCVSPAWRTIQHKEGPNAIHPILSTGTKIWHLRKESTFYPKMNFQNSVANIPDNSTVIFVFGEIDCREALLSCVEQCKYDSLQEGILALLDVYVSVLSELQKKNKWRVYVHPVPPVLDVTRQTVIEFNSLLKKRIEKENDLHFLDILGELCEENGNLKKEMEFDGTHLNPSYTAILEKTL